MVTNQATSSNLRTIPFGTLLENLLPPAFAELHPLIAEEVCELCGGWPSGCGSVDEFLESDCWFELPGVVEVVTVIVTRERAAS